jgi:hypothetical protein
MLAPIPAADLLAVAAVAPSCACVLASAALACFVLAVTRMFRTAAVLAIDKPSRLCYVGSMKRLATILTIAALGLTACGGSANSETAGFPSCEAVESGEAAPGNGGVCVMPDGSPGFAE